MTEWIAAVHYGDLAGKDPEDVCRRALCRYDHDGLYYEMHVWGDTYTVFPHARRIECQQRGAGAIGEYFPIFLIHYLLMAVEKDVENEWISEKDIPGGVTFFRGPHAIPTDLVIRAFQNDLPAFARQCRALKGDPLDMADAAFRFQITARIPVAMLYWQGDEDFPPEASVLFDRSIHRHLATDAIFALAVEICLRVSGSTGLV